MVQFECCVCHASIIHIAIDEAPVPPRCLVCTWIEAEVDPADYADVKKLLGVEGPT